jgi:phospholipid transport system substrate-binding protein
MISLIAAAVLVCGAPVSGAGAPGPMDTLKKPIDDVITILQDPAFVQPDQKTAQRIKIWQTIKGLFDFDEISRRTVGAKWSAFTEDEKKRFTEVFAEFLGNTYVDKMQGEFHNEKIVFLNQMVKEPLALVRTQLQREKMEIPIDYRMKQVDGNWYIYDILVEEGISLVRNYRVQFQDFLQKETPAKLIEQLEKKLVDENKTILNAS